VPARCARSWRKAPVTSTLELMSRDIAVSDMLDRLTAIARRFDSTIDFEAVPNIQAWCKAIGMPEDNPFLCGKTVQRLETGCHLILLAARITPEMQASVISAMLFHGKLPPGEIALLANPQTFLKHLVLHEVAHAIGHSRSEEECDRWAFQQLEAV
jgi:hypothetical protein